MKILCKLLHVYFIDIPSFKSDVSVCTISSVIRLCKGLFRPLSKRAIKMNKTKKIKVSYIRFYHHPKGLDKKEFIHA
jgi:hypothetical protein